LQKLEDEVDDIDPFDLDRRSSCCGNVSLFLEEEDLDRRGLGGDRVCFLDRDLDRRGLGGDRVCFLDRDLDRGLDRGLKDRLACLECAVGLVVFASASFEGGFFGCDGID
jgi:hypothetical protein